MASKWLVSGLKRGEGEGGMMTRSKVADTAGNGGYHMEGSLGLNLRPPRTGKMPKISFASVRQKGEEQN